MAVKFFHVSDTHLGYYDFETQDRSGENIRESDVYRAFEYVIDRAVEEKPDFVLHSGDLFHRAAPSNKTMVEAKRILKKLADAGIPLYMIAGNHDYPKSVLTAPIHSLYEIGPGKIFYGERYETQDCGVYTIHALPHINEDARLQEEIEKIHISNPSSVNILMLHLSVGDFYIMQEFGERMLPKEKRELLKSFTYTALGHWHRPQQLEKYGNTYYAGSTERISISEAQHKHGYYCVTAGDELTVEFKDIPLRPIHQYSVQSCKTKPKELIIAEITEHFRDKDITGSIVLVTLDELKQTQFFEIKQEEITGLFPDALYSRVFRQLEGSAHAEAMDGDSIDFNERLLETVAGEFDSSEEKEKALQVLRGLLETIDEEEASREN